MSEADFSLLRSKLFPVFLEKHPAAQSYVTQSATRINFVAEKILGLTLEARQTWRCSSKADKTNAESGRFCKLTVACLPTLTRSCTGPLGGLWRKSLPLDCDMLVSWQLCFSWMGGISGASLASGYGIPTEVFPHFVSSSVEILQTVTQAASRHIPTT